MYLEVFTTHSGPDVALVDASDFKSFKILVRSGTSTRDAQTALRDVAEFVDAHHAHVSIDAVRSLSGRNGDAAWDAGFAAMLSHAESAGWMTVPGRVDAHCEYEAGAAS